MTLNLAFMGGAVLYYTLLAHLKAAIEVHQNRFPGLSTRDSVTAFIMWW